LREGSPVSNSKPYTGAEKQLRKAKATLRPGT
jgi:hypothetical protein